MHCGVGSSSGLTRDMVVALGDVVGVGFGVMGDGIVADLAWYVPSSILDKQISLKHNEFRTCTRRVQLGCHISLRSTQFLCYFRSFTKMQIADVE